MSKNITRVERILEIELSSYLNSNYTNIHR